MSEDGKIGMTALIMAALLLGGAAFGGFHCQVKQTEAINDCVKAGRLPLECRTAIRGTQ